MLERLRRRRGQEGFTLIELLVVVIIIGLLAAIAIPAFLGQRNKANDAAAKSLVRNGATAMEAYFSDGNTYVGADRHEPAARSSRTSSGQTTGRRRRQRTRSTYGTPTATTYTLSTVSKSGTTYSYAKNLGAAAGTSTVTRTCNPTTACRPTAWPVGGNPPHAPDERGPALAGGSAALFALPLHPFPPDALGTAEPGFTRRKEALVAFARTDSRPDDSPHAPRHGSRARRAAAGRSVAGHASLPPPRPRPVGLRARRAPALAQAARPPRRRPARRRGRPLALQGRPPLEPALGPDAQQRHDARAVPGAVGDAHLGRRAQGRRLHRSRSPTTPASAARSGPARHDPGHRGPRDPAARRRLLVARPGGGRRRHPGRLERRRPRGQDLAQPDRRHAHRGHARPAPSASFTALNPYLFWNPVPGAKSYDVQVSPGDQFNNVVFTGTNLPAAVRHAPAPSAPCPTTSTAGACGRATPTTTSGPWTVASTFTKAWTRPDADRARRRGHHRATSLCRGTPIDGAQRYEVQITDLEHNCVGAPPEGRRDRPRRTRFTPTLAGGAGQRRWRYGDLWWRVRPVIDGVYGTLDRRPAGGSTGSRPPAPAPRRPCSARPATATPASRRCLSWTPVTGATIYRVDIADRPQLQQHPRAARSPPAPRGPRARRSPTTRSAPATTGASSGAPAPRSTTPTGWSTRTSSRRRQFRKQTQVTLGSPGQRAASSSDPPLLSWGSVPGIAKYDVELSQDGQFRHRHHAQGHDLRPRRGPRLDGRRREAAARRHLELARPRGGRRRQGPDLEPRRPVHAHLARGPPRRRRTTARRSSTRR